MVVTLLVGHKSIAAGLVWRWIVFVVPVVVVAVPLERAKFA